MKPIVKALLVAGSLGLASAAAVAPANAAVGFGITLNGGNVAFGYQDGYWDRGHHWHAWRNASEARWYRDHYRSSYYDWRHDRDRDNGWHRR